ncbi:hypothetical protein [Gracilibacillus saliphilus]|uniref:hypothetical protein n=1 Tax=Gracilibacillus saliphilus TaxID=543890 RepID=UPI0013D89975|nr:hypothetical protein [Gracilibacillus saliphilus]
MGAFYIIGGVWLLEQLGSIPNPDDHQAQNHAQKVTGLNSRHHYCSMITEQQTLGIHKHSCSVMMNQ